MKRGPEQGKHQEGANQSVLWYNEDHDMFEEIQQNETNEWIWKTSKVKANVWSCSICRRPYVMSCVCRYSCKKRFEVLECSQHSLKDRTVYETYPYPQNLEDIKTDCLPFPPRICECPVFVRPHVFDVVLGPWKECEHYKQDEGFICNVCKS